MELEDNEREEIISVICEDYEDKEVKRLKGFQDNHIYEEYETHLGEYPDVSILSDSLASEIANYKADEFWAELDKKTNSELLDIHEVQLGREYERSEPMSIWEMNGFTSAADFWRWKEG